MQLFFIYNLICLVISSTKAIFRFRNADDYSATHLLYDVLGGAVSWGLDHSVRLLW